MIRPGRRHDSVRAANILRRQCPVGVFEHPTHGRVRQMQPGPGKYLRNLHLPQRRTQCLEPHDRVPHEVLNRFVARLTNFEKPDDGAAFLCV